MSLILLIFRKERIKKSTILCLRTYKCKYNMVVFFITILLMIIFKNELINVLKVRDYNYITMY